MRFLSCHCSEGSSLLVQLSALHWRSWQDPELAVALKKKQPPKTMSLREHRQTSAAEPENEERTMTHRPVVLPDSYSGEAEFSEWHDHFENVAAVNRWDDDAKLLWLKVRLTGRAQKAFKRLPQATQGKLPAHHGRTEGKI